MARAVDAFGAALARTRHVLFEPFDASKYVVLGFCVWLSQLGSASGTSSSSAGQRSWSGPPPGAEADPWEGWQALAAWGPTIAAIVGLALLVGIAVWALVLFLQCRGTFMAIDGIVRDRGAVKEPWAAWAAEADALFRFRLSVTFAALAGAVLAMGLAGAGVWATWDGVALGVAQMAMLGVAGLLTALVVLAAVIADNLALELVAPLMYARRLGVREGFADLWGFARDDVGGFVLYVVLRLVASVVVSALAAVATCLTCGLAMLPFVGTLVLLPALVFLRAFSLEFVARLGDDLERALRPA